MSLGRNPRATMSPSAPRVDSVVITGDRGDRRPNGSQNLCGTEVRGRLDHGGVAVIDHRTRDEIERLLRPVGDQHLVDGHPEAARDELAQVAQAFRRSVLQGARIERGGEGTPESFDGQRLGRRQTARE